MKTESGRSLIEIVGVLAIAGIMTAATWQAASMLRNNMRRTTANQVLQQIARDIKLLLQMRGDYTGVSVDYLIKEGALQNDAAPIGGAAWSVTSSADGMSFSINLVELTQSECEYFSTTAPSWSTSIMVNGSTYDPDTRCFSSSTNQVSFIVE